MSRPRRHQGAGLGAAPPRGHRGERGQLVVEYALRDVDKPIGVAQWETRLVETLPVDLEGSLPTIAQLEAELANERK